MDNVMDGSRTIEGESAVEVAPTIPMSETTKMGLGILAAAILLGVLGDAMFRATPWGINVLLWVGTLVLAVIGLLEWRNDPAEGGGRWLVFPLLFSAGSLAWRASAMLTALNILGVLVCLALAAMYTQRGRLRVAGIADYTWSVIVACLQGMVGPLVLLFGTIKWKSIPRSGWSGQMLAIGRGLVIALPLLFLFGGLFMAADAVFEGIVTDMLNINMDKLLGHLFLIAFWGWLSAGFLRQTLLEGGGGMASFGERPSFARLGIIEVAIVLGALNLLFLAFVMVQFRYFFGGASLVEASLELTYSEYARRGFFELVTVAALVLPLLLGIHWLLYTEHPGHHRLFRGLAGALIGLLYVIMFSAVQRMLLYQAEYGQTELRLYTTSFMGWLAVVFAWFMGTVLRGQRERFVFGALVLGFATLALLHLINPDALIVRTNVSRPTDVHPLDIDYLFTLEADAVPTLVGALPTLREADRCVVAARLLREWSPPERTDWRTWNWGRHQAWQSVRQNLGTLQTAACEIPGRLYD